MKREIITVIIGLASLTLLMTACRKWDEFKKYTASGEIVYTGKLDSVKIYSGKKRVRLTGVIKSDPKVTQLKVFWNEDQDSATFALKRENGTGIRVDTVFSVLDEGIKSFKIVTYDVDDNPSVAVTAVGVSYGNAYRSKLTARQIVSKTFASNKTTIAWQIMDPFLGPLYTETLYEVNGSTLMLQTPVDSPTSVLDEFDIRSSGFQYRTVYRPDSTCIDTFATPYISVPKN